MREYELLIDKAFINGLSSVDNIPINNQSLYTCYGFRCHAAGLKSYPIPLLGPDVQGSWPYPQVVSGETYSLMAVMDSGVITTYELDLSTNHITSICNSSIQHNIALADFGNYAVLSNGEQVYERTLADPGWTNKPINNSFPLLQDMINFKGQIFGCGPIQPWYTCDAKYYCWSRIGSADFTLNEANEAGFRKDPYGGDALRVKRLGDTVIGYSTKGITMFKPVASPAATFATMEISPIGLYSPLALAGDLTEHLFIGTDLRLYRVTMKEGVKLIRYGNIVSSLSSNPLLLFDPTLRDFYISSDSRTFLLSHNGMSEVPIHPTAVWRATNNDLYVETQTIDVTHDEVVTEPFDFGYRGQKTITAIESDIKPPSNVSVAVDYLDQDSLWQTTPYIPLNPDGAAAITIVADTFRFRLRSDTDISRLSYVKVRYKMSDLRSIRGVYAPPLRGQQV